MHAVDGRIAHGELPSDSNRTDFDDSDPMLTGWNVMFLLAGHLAGKATDTFVLIKKERTLIHF